MINLAPPGSPYLRTGQNDCRSSRCRLWGLWEVDCEGYMASLAHNLKKAVKHLGDSVDPPEPEGARGTVTALTG